MTMNDIETAVIREWKGNWAKGLDRPLPLFPPGGYVVTFHKGMNSPYKVEHYNTVEEITEKYQGYYWMSPDGHDAPDIVLVGI